MSFIDQLPGRVFRDTVENVSKKEAVRLSVAFETSVEIWFNQQLQYDLLLAEQQGESLHACKLSVA